MIARYYSSDAPPAPSQPLAEGTYHVVRVVDGDTIIIHPHAIVRLIGVNTPETVKPEHPVEPFGPEASAFTKGFLSGGTARLAFDRERVDHYGRFLAYVWVGERMLNEELLRHGLARHERQFHYSQVIKDRFRQAEREAKQAHLGIWSLPRPGDRSRSALTTYSNQGICVVLPGVSCPSVAVYNRRFTARKFPPTQTLRPLL